MRTIPAADQLGAIVEYDLWTDLLAGVVGLAVGSSVFFVTWLRSLIRLGCFKAPSGQVALWLLTVLAALGLILAGLIATSADAPAGIGSSLADDTRPISIVAGVSMVPGLMAFLAIRWGARHDDNWREPPQCRIHLVLRLRAELRRLLGAFGAFLTLLVVTTGMRRRTLLEFDPEVDEPVAGVLLYGLVFAVLLGSFFAAASGAIEDRTEQMIDEMAPITDYRSKDFSQLCDRREKLHVLLGQSSSWKSFETAVVIAAPLLTALIGTATGD